MRKRYYIASWSCDDDRGIYCFDYDFGRDASGEVFRCAEINNASYFARFGDILYAVSENQGPGEFGGELHSFRIIDSGLEKIDCIGGILSGSPHISVSADGRFIYVCSYNSGMSCSVQTEDGVFVKVSEPIRIKGSSIVPERQDSPHAHIMCPAPDGYIISCDLGTDEIISYSSKPDDGSLFVVNRLKVPAGYGPRHMVFSQSGKFIYVVCELRYHLLTFSYMGKGMLKLVKDSPVLEDLPDNANWGGAIKLSRDGALLFTSNRPENMSSIDVFSLSDPSSPQILSSSNLCNHPRDFILIDGGSNEYLMCLSMTDNLLRIYRFDRNSASFCFLSEVKGIPKPVCVIQA